MELDFRVITSVPSNAEIPSSVGEHGDLHFRGLVSIGRRVRDRTPSCAITAGSGYGRMPAEWGFLSRDTAMWYFPVTLCCPGGQVTIPSLTWRGWESTWPTKQDSPIEADSSCDFGPQIIGAPYHGSPAPHGFAENYCTGTVDV